MNIPNEVILTVSELSAAVKHTIEDNVGYVSVRGEVSGYRGPHSSGHAYFALKDQGAKIDAIVWRSLMSKLRFLPEEGLEVIARGKLTTFASSSKYQIIIESLEPTGVGTLMAILEERKQKFAKEGLFAADRKKAIPYFPGVIGVITSITGAALQDILRRLSDRCPVRVLIWSVRVQGVTSAEEVAKAIQGFNESSGINIPRPDVLIVARGGGSLEDLWSFNEEVVVRAAAASKIPLVSAIGHETDWTLLDFVADLRAPTPTGAAEMITPIYAEITTALINLKARLEQSIAGQLSRVKLGLRSNSKGLPSAQRLLLNKQQRIDLAASSLYQKILLRKTRLQHRVAALTSKLSPMLLVIRIRNARRQIESVALRNQRTVDFILQRILSEKLCSLNYRIKRLLPELLKVKKTQIERLVQLVEYLSYERILARGFVIIYDKNGNSIKSISQVHPEMKLVLHFYDGCVNINSQVH